MDRHNRIGISSFRGSALAISCRNSIPNVTDGSLGKSAEDMETIRIGRHAADQEDKAGDRFSVA